MENLQNYTQTIENHLKESENLVQTLNRTLSLLTQEIRYIFSKIEDCPKIEMATTK